MESSSMTIPQLSLVTRDSSGFAWQQLNPLSREARELARFLVAPAAKDLQVSPNGREALIVLRDKATTERVRRIDLATGQALPVPPLPHDLVLCAGYTKEGDVLLFVADNRSLQVVEGPDGTAWMHEGQRFPFDRELEGSGQYRLSLAQVFKLTPRGLERLERTVIAQRSQSDVDMLESAALLVGAAPRDALRTGEKAFVADDAWAAAWGRSDAYVEWHERSHSGRRIRYLGSSRGRQASTIVVQADQGFVSLPELESSDRTSGELDVSLRGNYLLMVDPEGKASKLYDLRDASLVWTAPAGSSVDFWPLSA